ncbi:MAG: translation initiation factor eIF-2B [Candidatus Thorarchaeota archaeon]
MEIREFEGLAVQQNSSKNHETVSPSFQNALQRIRDDSSSGAAEIALQVLKAIQIESKASSDLSKQKQLQNLQNCAKLLLKTHPEMAVLDSVLREFLGRVETQFLERKNLIDQSRVIDAVYLSLSQDLRLREDQVAANLANHLEGYSTIITLSWSSTVYHSLAKLIQNPKAQTKKIIVAESRPLLEGRTLAAKLGQLGFEVNLIIDAAMGRFCSEADIAICGADTVLANGSILNKVGTYLLALCCAHYARQIPFVVASTTTKFSYPSLKENYTPIINQQPPEEILENWQTTEVLPRNEYFEIVPQELISALITEKGAISQKIGENVKQILQERFNGFTEEVV